MILCQCHAVTDGQVCDVVHAGARTVRQVVRATHAGTGCGGCLPQIRQACVRALAAVESEGAQEALAG